MLCRLLLLFFLFAAAFGSLGRKNPCLRRNAVSIIEETSLDNVNELEEHGKVIQTDLHRVCGGDWGVIVLKDSALNGNVFYSISIVDEDTWVHVDRNTGLRYVIFKVEVSV
ncbi:hypothetical protein L596_012239 [Steinernema carpocapsae]|uniref:Uncharacterized protein n=1 Tax=Steinernema carpocapsae TaxID=34508 RepID=A0A4U5NWU4_STECR|nr:hypothetical protein L596_012239 [Steinernema carpocapsae]